MSKCPRKASLTIASKALKEKSAGSSKIRGIPGINSKETLNPLTIWSE